MLELKVAVVLIILILMDVSDGGKVNSATHPHSKLWYKMDGASPPTRGGMLQPRSSESRQIQLLDGMWHFRADMSPSRSEGFVQQWFAKPLAMTGAVIPMPVPSSFNDITTDRSLLNFVGWVWYDHTFFVPRDWNDKRIVFRVDSAHYNAIVWINGKEIVQHSGGHLPFGAVVNNFVELGVENRVTVAVNNTLTPHTLPPGTITFHTNETGYPPGYFVQNLQFDFFNYAGIHRHVFIYTTPMKFIDDITVVTDVAGAQGHVQYTVGTEDQTLLLKESRRKLSPTLYFDDNSNSDVVSVEVLDHVGNVVASGTGPSGTLVVDRPTLWWPYSMNKENFGYRYTLKVTYGEDVYRLPFGIRTVRHTDSKILINDQPFYCHGVAKHEDSDIRGKGLDLPLIARDFNMLKWLGANCFRTSHYPYAEEIMDQADAQGIVVIDECPGVGITQDENFGEQSLAHHLQVMTELVTRDKNRPSVIMWSVANEPATSKSISVPYFKSVIEHTRALDPTRLVTFVCSQSPHSDLVIPYVDVICTNHYYGWYQDTGHLETITYQMSANLQQWRAKYLKPIIVTEYGADTVPGLHSAPSWVFTEDYQTEFLALYHNVFDEFRKTYLVGEMVWNFADFMTTQTIERVVGNRKGLLTRQRQPKMAARLIRERYWSMINATSRSPDPEMSTHKSPRI